MASVLQIVGLASVVVGAALIAPAAGFVVFGLACVGVGLAVEAARRTK